ncbi:MAG: phosphoethanolamine transferase [Ginsengibacter sp.]
MNYQKYFKKEALIRLSLLLLLVVVPNILYFIILHEKRKLVLINNLFLISLAILLLKPSFTKIVGYFLLFILVINNSLEIFSQYFYKSSFNVGMALSFLSSNARESFEMSSSYWFVFLIALCYYVLICISANSIKKYVSNKVLIFSCLLLMIYPAYLLRIESSNNRYNNNTLYKKAGESDLYLYMGSTPISAFGPFLEAHHYLGIVKQASEEDYHYPPFEMQNNNIQNLVVVLGESARRDALSLYGDPINTTPYIQKRISNLLVYNNAVSPGEFTNLALSLILSKQIPDNNFSIEKNNDNIIALANATNIWKTYWVSNQEKTGLYVNLFANINLKSKYKYWTIPGSYDEAIFPLIDNILKDTTKKRLIFIHLMGSHAEAGMRYPKTFDKFHSEKEEFKNEYNNSIAYTDYILDNIIKKMEGTSSILLYLSDHGQSIEDGAYRHSTTKKGFDVPFFIWYSDSVENKYKKLGKINSYISTTNVYNILQNLMGIQGLEPKKQNDSLKVMDASMKPSFYKDLKPGK